VEPLEEIAESLAGQGWAVSRRVYRAEAVESLAAEARRLHAAGEFRRAGIGRGARREVQEEVRRDEIFWLRQERATAAQAFFWEGVERIRADLNRLLFLGLQEFEGHLAVFPPQGFYRRHLDRFSDADERVLSAVLFLNPGWRAEEGGALRLHLPTGPVDVLPEAGTFAVFRSELIWHEVLPAASPRFSATGWYRRRTL